MVTGDVSTWADECQWGFCIGRNGVDSLVEMDAFARAASLTQVEAMKLGDPSVPQPTSRLSHGCCDEIHIDGDSASDDLADGVYRSLDPELGPAASALLCMKPR